MSMRDTALAMGDVLCRRGAGPIPIPSHFFFCAAFLRNIQASHQLSTSTDFEQMQAPVVGRALKADAKFKMSEITPNVKVARCKTP